MTQQPINPLCQRGIPLWIQLLADTFTEPTVLEYDAPTFRIIQILFRDVIDPFFSAIHRKAQADGEIP